MNIGNIFEGSCRYGTRLWPAAAILLAISMSSVADQPADTHWPSWGNKYDEQNYSPLQQINDKNVGELKLDWELELPDAVSFAGTPLEVDGVLYFSGDLSIVRAVDARTGKLLWKYDPETYRYNSRRGAIGWNTNRGVAYLNGKVFVGVLDGRLIAIDAKSGKKVWETQTFGPGEEHGKAITGAPRAFGNIVVIGFGGAEYEARGYISAYAADTGKLLWRFYTVPGDPARKDGVASDDVMPMMRKTWHGQYWKHGGGGTVWEGITYDPELDQVYFGTSNGEVWNYDIRSEGKGDNLFSASIVALNAQTGKYVWHYQTTPGERWDYDSNQISVLADLNVGGVTHKALMHANKNGFFYVIDRKNGKLLSANTFSKVTWASGIDLKTGRPIENETVIRGKDGTSVLYPGTFGAHNWQSMSYNPQTGLVYIPETQQPTALTPAKEDAPSRQNFINIGVAIEYVTVDPEHDGRGSLLAWDPVAQKARWKFPYDSFWNGGTATTGGNLVFQGTGDGKFRAFNAATGAKLWEIDAQRGITTTPITYALDGTQHVAMLVGYGGLSTFGTFTTKYRYKYKDAGIRLLSFSLNGKETLRKLKTRNGEFNPVDPGSAPIDATLAKRGSEIYGGASCAVCHGLALDGGSTAPDLRESRAAQSYRVELQILKEGSLAPDGMPQFADLTDSEIKALVEYIRQQTLASRAPKEFKPDVKN